MKMLLRLLLFTSLTFPQRVRNKSVCKISTLARRQNLTQTSDFNHINHFSLMKVIDNAVSTNGFESISLIFPQFLDFIDIQLCNSMIREYTGSNKYVYSVLVYIQMHKFGILPDSSTFPSVLKAIAKLGKIELGRTMHGIATRMGFQCDVYVNTALVHVYSTCLSIRDARILFDEMPERNSVSWNSLITGYTHNRMFVDAIDVFRQMLEAGAEPSERTVVGVLSACAHLGALNQGKWIHEFINHKSLTLNVYVGTALIDMYAKCGAVEEAEKVFEAIREKNIYTWNVLISGFAMNGQGIAALHAFYKMVTENFKPDYITFLGVLSACSHEGLVAEGRSHFVSMKEHFRVIPRIEHYGCMIGLLGRAGYLEEARELIQSMSINPDPVIWRALLFACRVHGNTKLGEHAAKKLIALEPKKGENYVLLSNLYARDKRWGEIGKLRETMDHMGIRKVPGCSSIEIENTVYEFVASNRMKPELNETYEMLNCMANKLKSAGYFVGTEVALYDIEEEEKEHSVIYHSEKLALAFGILKSRTNSNLRIVKNLRMCEDCHGFFKIVSLVYSRNITVRDRNLFHHFSGGVCSCKDYW